MQYIQCDEPHRELLCCGIHRPEVSHEVSFELQGAAKDSQSWNKKSPKCGPSPNKNSKKEFKRFPKGTIGNENSKMELKRSPKVDQIRIEHSFHTVYDCAINAVEKVNRREI
ncbi:hypothetical protein QVD17_41481 [Tagetes erecta]|uniref:Uncharacterized protein n=1 Tax=Tagetes erecta TaxID=13708 RepID=A0AAD8JKJ1_TARER|nr:hypothetical protein QVD17_41481 [Tagetes erecta]